MSRRKQPGRTFNCSDTDMMRRTQLHHDLFVKYLADFTAFNPLFSPSFADAWQSAIRDVWRLLAVKYRSPLETFELISALNALWSYSQRWRLRAK